MTTVGPPLHPSPASSQMPSLSPLNRMTDFCAQLKHRIFRQPGRSVRTRYRWSPVHLPVNLNVVANTNYHGCLGLPQELINHILDMLRDDIRSLKACSLTCKAMFASTRPLIHQTLYLTILNNERVLTQREKEERDSTIGRYYLDLRFLSYMGEHGLLQYTRRVCICSYNRFTPDISRPHLRHFQTLDRVHTLTIEYCYCPAWALERYHESCFAHFYPTLTSLAIRSPTEGSESILQFALQFPKLENLCLESVRRAPLSGLCWPVPDNFCHPPPLCGHLRLLGYDTMDQWPVDPSHELSGVIRFRSVELVDFLGEVATHILNTCAGSLEDLTVAPHKNRREQLLFLDLTRLTVLRRFTLRMPIDPKSEASALLCVLSTIVSPTFHELVLELGNPAYLFNGSSSEDRGHWGEADKFLEEKFSKRGDFKVVIRTSGRYDPSIFRTYAKEEFPLMTSRGCIHFEASHT